MKIKVLAIRNGVGLAILAGLAASMAAIVGHHERFWPAALGRASRVQGSPALTRAASGAASELPAASSVGTFTAINAPGAGTGPYQGTVALGINASGDIVGFYMKPAFVFHAFIRNHDGTFTTFDAPNAGTSMTQGTIAIGIDSAGDVVGAIIDGNVESHGFVRTAAGKLTVIDAPGAGTGASRGTTAMGINDAGDIVGFYSTGTQATATTYHGFLRSAAGAFTNIEAPGAGSGVDPENGRKEGTEAYAINAAGQIAGSYVDASDKRHGFLRDANGSYSEFDAPGADAITTGKHQGMNGTSADSIDTAGDVEGTYTDSTGLRHGFERAADGTITTFGAPAAALNVAVLVGTVPFAISPSGETVAGLYTDGSGVSHGFERAGGKLTSFDAPAAGTAGTSMVPGTGAIGVNDAGEIAGLYVDGNAVFHGFLLTPGSTTPPAAATPTFTPAAGLYTTTEKVTIKDTTAGATIHYTTNGSTPTASSTKYTAPVEVAATTTIKAIAVAAGYSNSAVATGIYTIHLRAATPGFSPIAGNYSTSQSVTIGDTTTGAIVYYTTNGATPTTGSSRYTKAIKVTASETLKAIAVAAGETNSAVATATYKIGLPAAAAPKFSVAGGTYTSVQTIALSDTTPGVAIYYTTNGTQPTTASTKYAGAIEVKASETIKAIAAGPTRSNSAVATATYTIHLPG